MSDFKKLLRAAERSGWRVKRTTKGHWQLLPPAGPIVLVSDSRDPHAIRNIRAQMRRARA